MGGGAGATHHRSSDMPHDVVTAMQRMRVAEVDNGAQQQQQRPQGDANANRSKRYSSQRQRMTTPPPPPAGLPGPGPNPYVGNVNSAYYGPYGDNHAPPPPNYATSASTYPKTVVPLVAAQGAPPPPPSFIPTPLGFPAAYSGYPTAAVGPGGAPGPVPVGVPIASPTQDLYHAGAGGIMYYDTGRQVIQTNFYLKNPAAYQLTTTILALFLRFRPIDTRNRCAGPKLLYPSLLPILMTLMTAYWCRMIVMYTNNNNNNKYDCPTSLCVCISSCPGSCFVFLYPPFCCCCCCCCYYYCWCFGFYICLTNTKTTTKRSENWNKD